jgi:hypothetical protein
MQYTIYFHRFDKQWLMLSENRDMPIMNRQVELSMATWLHGLTSFGEASVRKFILME